MSNIISEKDELKIELSDKICSYGIDRVQAYDEANYISSYYENDKDYNIRIDLAKMSYDFNQELTKTERIHVINGMFYAKNELDSLKDKHISNSLSYLLSKLDKDQQENIIKLNDYEDAYFRYGVVLLFSISGSKKKQRDKRISK